MKYDVGLDKYYHDDGREMTSDAVAIAKKRRMQDASALAAADRTFAQNYGGSPSTLAGLGQVPAYGDVAADELSYKIPRQDGGFGFEKSPTPFPISDYRQTAVDIVEEVLKARKTHGPIASAHEGYAIMLEELDEVKEHVWMKQKLRDQAAMRKELVQLAAMAVAMIVEIADADNRR